MDVSYILPQFPEDKIVFLDNCAFSLSDYLGFYSNNRFGNYSEEYLDADLERLVELSEILDENTAWTTIDEVVSEFERGINCLKKRSKRLGHSKIGKKIMYELLQERNDVLKKINNETRLADNNISNHLNSIREGVYDKVKKIFLNSGGVPHESNTDTKLISTAIAYSHDDPVAIFSHDETLLYTYAMCAEKFDIKNAFIMSDKFDWPKPTEEWLDHVRKGKTKRYKVYD